MFCSKCGTEINNEAVICPNCGCPTSNFQKANEISQQTIENNFSSVINSSRTFGIIGIILGIFIPLAGWICGGVGLGKSKEILNREPNNREALSAKSLNIGAIVVSTIVFVIAFVATLIVMSEF